MNKKVNLNLIYLTICGIIIGIANSIPGVSGGTMAVVLGIYTSFITATNEIKNHPKKSLTLIIPICIGVLIGIFGFSYIIVSALEYYPMITNFFFIGLILGSIAMLFKKTLEQGYTHKMIAPFLIAFIAVVISLFISPIERSELITLVSLDTVFILFISGVVSSFAMIVPGISGSLLLLLVGTFSSINMAIISFNIPVLLVFCMGSITGVALGTKIIAYLLAKHYKVTYAGILGLVIGSIFVIYPGFSFNTEGIIALLFCMLGTVITFWFSKKQMIKD